MQMDCAAKCGGTRLKGISAENTRDRPLVSVVTVIFNGEQYVENACKAYCNRITQTLSTS